MADSIWRSTLEELRGQVSSRDPVPAGVSMACIAACLGLSLLQKVLEITRHRSGFSGDARRIEEMLTAARSESDKLKRCADEDIAAYREYMALRRSAEQAVALRRAIEVPLKAARAAAAGLDLCASATAFTPAAIAPDLGTAAILLEGAVRAIALSIDSNVEHAADVGFAAEVRGETRELLSTSRRAKELAAADERG